MKVAIETTVEIAEGSYCITKVQLKYNDLSINIWTVYHSLKIEQGGNIRMGSISYLFQSIKLSYSENFHAKVRLRCD